jgi:hypothetical protein
MNGSKFSAENFFYKHQKQVAQSVGAVGYCIGELVMKKNDKNR